MFSLGEQMRPVVTYESEIGPEFTAIALQRQDQKVSAFPLKCEKQKEVDESKSIKANLVEVAKIVQGSSKSKQ